MKNFNASYGTQRPCLLKSPGLRQFALLPCKKAVPFTITQKEKKKNNLGANLTKHVWYLYAVIYKMLMKAIQDLNIWRDILWIGKHSWIRRLNIIRIVNFPKADRQA